MRAKFMHVSELLTQVAEGIGVGNNALISAARTEYGTLAVKTAAVKIDFVLTSDATAGGLAVPGVGANTLLGFGVRKDSETSRATITLNIVPISPTEPPSKPAVSTTGLLTQDPGKTTTTTMTTDGGAVTPSEPLPSEAKTIAADLEKLKPKVMALPESSPEKKVMIVDLMEISQLLKAGRLADAQSAINAFLAKYKRYKLS